jgi:branched-chain amino acid aminotransferase
MNECFGRRFILNGELKDAVTFDNSLVYDGDSVYEVLRMARGIPVFFQDHMERLSSSVSLQGKEMIADAASIKRSVIMLTRADRQKETNLKIVFNYNEGQASWLIYYIEPTYPSAAQYRNGVKGILFHAERKNPESKVINHKLRSAIYHRLILESAYEALLVSDMNLITEGSRSNIFFLRGDELITAPENMILSGITRKHILSICTGEKIPVRLECVPKDELDTFESVFMTGTSPMVLPFCCIDDLYFEVDKPLITKLRKLYLERSEESIRHFRNG